MLSFSNIQAHADGVQNKINPTTKMLHALLKKVLEVIHVYYISSNYWGIYQLSKFIDFTHP